MEKTLVVHIKKAKYDVYIGRPSIFGNQFTHHTRKTLAVHQVPSRFEAIKKYRDWLIANPNVMQEALALRGKTLGCWCCNKPSDGDLPLRKMVCHGQVLAALCNSQVTNTEESIDFLSKL